MVRDIYRTPHCAIAIAIIGMGTMISTRPGQIIRNFLTYQQFFIRTTLLSVIPLLTVKYLQKTEFIVFFEG